MVQMIIKMTGITVLYVILTIGLWDYSKNKKPSTGWIIFVGLIYGGCSVLSTHFAVDYGHMLLNLRDAAPLAAGLFFHPAAGVIAGLIGGIERYIVGTYFNIGSYTRIACSVSTCLAGFVALLMNVKVFKGKKPAPAYAFFMGALMEVFHMYVVFITHRGDMRMAFHVVSICSIPMIVFTGIALSVMSVLLEILSGEWKKPIRELSGENVPVSQTFQRCLFCVTAIVIIVNFAFSYAIQTESAYQNGCTMIEDSAQDIKDRYFVGIRYVTEESSDFFEIVNEEGKVITGTHKDAVLNPSDYEMLKSHKDEGVFETSLFGEKVLCQVDNLSYKYILITYIPDSELYWFRNAQVYETALADIMLFSVIYVLIAFLVRLIVVRNIDLINESLDKITNGNLNEVVNVRSSSEFASLSDDINQTVDALKGYIDAAEKRIEQELIFAKAIQESALPKNFDFPGMTDVFDIYAAMKTAKVVGGDFYDFFFVGRDKLVLVIADVSGKGIPASLFMMRSKTAIRTLAEDGGTPSEIIAKGNETLCEGNDAEMFVTTWIGIIDLKTGVMKCANAGHEYPYIMRKGGEFELLKDKHTLALAVMDELKAKEYEITLNPGDRIFVYTDGIPEAIDENEDQYGNARLTAVLNSVKDRRFKDIMPVVFKDVENFKNKAEQFDDITMLGFELKKLI